MKRAKEHKAVVRRLHKLEEARRRRAARRLILVTKLTREVPLNPYEDRHVMPIEIGLEGYRHDQLVETLSAMRSTLLAGKGVCLDFRRTELMIAAGSLLLFSEIHRLKAIFPHSAWRCVPPRSNRVAQVLQHLGLFEQLNFDSDVVPDRPDVVSWRKASSSKVDGTRIGTVLGTYQSLKWQEARQLFRGASEAMINAINHAYTAPREDGLPRPDEEKWWLFCRESEESLFVGVCDLGIGIPRSLPKKYPEEYLQAALRQISRGAVRTDARIIEAAMEIERTRTDTRGRGRGLSDLKRVVDEVCGGQLFIFSNKGLLKYTGGAYTRTNFERSIKGTVVLWIIPLTGDGNVQLNN